MKLNDVIRLFEPFIDVKIWIKEDEENEPAFEGSLIDIPWIYLDMYIDVNDKGEGFDVYNDDAGKAILAIYLREKE